jgi:hypothetical protein
MTRELSIVEAIDPQANVQQEEQSLSPDEALKVLKSGCATACLVYCLGTLALVLLL